MAEQKMLKITLVKSPIGAVPKHRATVESMGLRKLNKSSHTAGQCGYKRPDSADQTFN